jgi:hypothetical protein
MSAGDVEGFAAVAFPIVRRVFAGLIANDLVSVQPMSLPSGLIFFLDFTFSDNLGTGTISSRSGNSAGDSIYGTDRVGSQVTGGVNLIGSLKQDLSGPRTAGARGYAFASPVGSDEVTSSVLAITRFGLTGSTEAQKKGLAYDPDLLAISSSGQAGNIIRIDVPQAQLDDQLDYNNLAAVTASIASLNDILDTTHTTSDTAQIRRLTQITGSTTGNVQLYFHTTVNCVGGGLAGGVTKNLDIGFPIDDALQAGGALGSVVGTTDWGLELLSPLRPRSSRLSGPQN